MVVAAVAASAAATQTMAFQDPGMTCEPPAPALTVRDATSDVVGRVERVRVLSSTPMPDRIVIAQEAEVVTVRILAGRPIVDRFVHRFSNAPNCLGSDLPLAVGDEAVFFFRDGEVEPFEVVPTAHYDLTLPDMRYPQRKPPEARP